RGEAHSATLARAAPKMAVFALIELLALRLGAAGAWRSVPVRTHPVHARLLAHHGVVSPPARDRTTTDGRGRARRETVLATVRIATVVPLEAVAEEHALVAAIAELHVDPLLLAAIGHAG